MLSEAWRGVKVGPGPGPDTPGVGGRCFPDLQCHLMPRKRPQSVKKYHDRVAGRYDHSYDDAFWKWHDEITWEHLKSHLPADQHDPVIDLGCGTGKWGLKLVKSGYHVTFLDISHQMVDQARLKVDQMGATARTDFLAADIADLSCLEERRFKLAMAFGEPICCTPSPLQTLKQIRRILAPDGRLVATFDNKLAALDFYLERGKPAEVERFLRDGRTHWLTRDRDERFPIITASPSELEDLVAAAGFTLLDMMGKTVLPMRQHRQLLHDSAARRRWARIEKLLCRRVEAMGRAPHLQFACRPA